MMKSNPMRTALSLAIATLLAVPVIAAAEAAAPVSAATGPSADADTATATITSSTSCAARVMTSRWPTVMGSKVPGVRARFTTAPICAGTPAMGGLVSQSVHESRRQGRGDSAK